MQQRVAAGAPTISVLRVTWFRTLRNSCNLRRRTSDQSGSEMETEVNNGNVWGVDNEKTFAANGGYNSQDYKHLDMKSELAFSSIGNGAEFADTRWSNREYASIVFPITAGAW